MMQRVLVCGGRYYRDKEHLYAVLDAFHAREEIFLVIHGDSGELDSDGRAVCGADKIAGNWAWDRKVPLQVFPAQWDKWGPPAGPIRNTQMLTVGQPTVVIAFPGGKGTANMIKQAEQKGIPVMRMASGSETQKD